MSEFEAEIKNSIRGLTAAVNKLADANKKADGTMKGLATSANTASTSVAKVGTAHEKAGRLAEQHARKVKELDKSTQGYMRALTATGGGIGSFGSKMGILSKLGPMAIGAAGGVIVLKQAVEALMAVETRRLKNFEDVFNRTEDIRDARKSNAMQAGANADKYARAAFAGASSAEVSEDVTSGGATSVDDALAAHTMIQQQVAPEWQDRVRAQAAKAVRGFGAGSMQEAVEKILADAPAVGKGMAGRGSALGGMEALQARLGKSGELAGTASGVDADTFSVNASRAMSTGFGQAALAYRAGEGQRQLTLDAQVTQPAGVAELKQAFKEAVQEVVTPGAKAAQKEIDLGYGKANQASPIMEVLRDMGWVLGMNDGSLRRRADNAAANIRNSYANAQGQ